MADGRPQGTFPLPALPAPRWRWDEGMRAYGANRSKGRAHAGVDLYADEFVPVLAVADGVVLRVAPFYAGTDAVEVDHGQFTVRYGEVRPRSVRVRPGQRVSEGEQLAEVGHLQGIRVPSDMLHLEMYRGSADGPLTVTGRGTARHTNGRPFYRRKDILDPTPFLDAWAERLVLASRPTLRNGARGPAVEALQRALRTAGHYSGEVDGKYGDGTEKSVRVYQTCHGLSVDGVAGKEVWGAIDKAGL